MRIIDLNGDLYTGELRATSLAPVTRYDGYRFHARFTFDGVSIFLPPDREIAITIKGRADGPVLAQALSWGSPDALTAPYVGDIVFQSAALTTAFAPVSGVAPASITALLELSLIADGSPPETLSQLPFRIINALGYGESPLPPPEDPDYPWTGPDARYQHKAAALTALAALTLSSGQAFYATGVNTFAPYTLTAAGRALLDDVDAAAQRTTLGLNNVENTALSTWSGSDSLTTMSGGTWLTTSVWTELKATGVSGFMIRPANATSSIYFGDTTDTGGYQFRGKGGMSVHGDHFRLMADGPNPYSYFVIGEGAMSWNKWDQAFQFLTTGHAYPIGFYGSVLKFGAGGTGDKVIVTSAGVGINTDTPGRLLDVRARDFAHNTVSYPSRISHTVYGSAPVAGGGVGIELENANAAGVDRVICTVAGEYTNATNAAESADFVVRVMDAGTLVEALRVGRGKVILNGLPESASGLEPGRLWSDGGILRIA